MGSVYSTYLCAKGGITLKTHIGEKHRHKSKKMKEELEIETYYGPSAVVDRYSPVHAHSICHTHHRRDRQ